MRVLRVTYRPGALAALSQVPEVKRQVRARAVAVRDDARRLAPVESGALRRSLAIVNVYDPQTRTVVYRVGWRTDIAFYGGLVELGTEDTPPQPHLRPAAWRNGGRVRNSRL